MKAPIGKVIKKILGSPKQKAELLDLLSQQNGSTENGNGTHNGEGTIKVNGKTYKLKKLNDDSGED